MNDKDSSCTPLRSSTQPKTHVSGAASPNDTPLTPIEALFWRVHEELDGDGMGAVIVWIEGCVEDAPLAAALAALQRRHPKLRSGILQAEDGSPYFHPYEHPRRIPLEVEDFEDELPQWQDAAYRALRIAIAPHNGPLARVALQRSRSRNRSRVTIIVHHVIYDGASLARIVDDLFTFYEKTEAGGDAGDVELRDLISIPRATLQGSFLSRLKVLAQLFRLRLAAKRNDWTPIPRAERPPTSLQSEKHIFSKAQTLTLVRRCRREKTSFYGVFFAAAVSVIVSLVGQKTARLRCHCPIDIRAHLTGVHGAPGNHDLGLFASAHDKIYKVAMEASFWDLARQADRDIKHYVDADGPQLAYNLMRFVRFAKFDRAREARIRTTLQVSHLGVTSIRPRYGSLKLTDFFALPKNDTVCPSIIVSGSVLGQRLTWGMVAANLPDVLWERFRKESVQMLERAIESGSQRGTD